MVKKPDPNTPQSKWTAEQVRKFGNVKKASRGEQTAQRAEGKTPKSPRLFKFGRKPGGGTVR